MLVTRIIGPCPGCGTSDSFGNVNIHSNQLTRGCTGCTFTQTLLLPELRKKVLYLDQSFLSHTFRDQLTEYSSCADLISDLTHYQLLVCPRSLTHEIETHQWRDSRRDQLWQFIKRTSRGHQFEPEYQIKHQQILDAFTRFRRKANTRYRIDRSDALDTQMDEWEDYFTVEVSGLIHNPEATRKAKSETLADLPALFQAWRNGQRSFEEHLLFEFRSAAVGYINMFAQMARRISQGDLMASLDSPIDSQIVDTILRDLSSESNQDLQSVKEFFESEYFRNVPYESISCGLVTVLRDHVKNGAYRSRKRIDSRLSGFFQDLNYVAAYAPYCDAMFIDSEMGRFVSDPRLQIKGIYGTKFFSKTSMSEFVAYLKSLEVGKTQELLHAIQLVHPPKGISTKS